LIVNNIVYTGDTIVRVSLTKKFSNNKSPITKLNCTLIKKVSDTSKGLIYHEKRSVIVSKISKLKRFIF